MPKGESVDQPWWSTDPDTPVQRRGRRRSNPQGDDGRGPVSEAEAEEIARTIILNRLDRSSASRAQLAELCAKRLVPDHIADRVLDRFEEVGLIDDAAYAAMLVRTRHSERQLAGKALRQELSRKGITGAMADKAMSQIDDEDEEEAARAVVTKRLRQASLQRAPRPVQERRLLAALARKGHRSEVAFRVIKQALDDLE
ncbi:MAG: regulatory protein RecX [Bowdeniella nasicola]|nr:regulatory protein RecX [Bowdeniella nasicola]